MVTQTQFFHNDHFTAGLLDGLPIIVVVRSSVSFASPDDAQRAFAPLLTALAHLDRSQHYLLLDSREAVGRNDPAYEGWFAQYRRDLFEGFPRSAVLLKTMVGQLHSKRLLTQDNAVDRARLFNDEHAAVDYLKGVHRASLAPPADESENS